MNVTVLGAGSWGTTVATLTTALNPTVLWARNPDVAAEVNANHTNASYMPVPSHATRPPGGSASADRRPREMAARGAEVLIAGGALQRGFRATIEDARKSDSAVDPRSVPWRRTPTWAPLVTWAR